MTKEERVSLDNAVERMEWVEYKEGFWQGGHSMTEDGRLYYSENYSTERLFERLKMDKEIGI